MTRTSKPNSLGEDLGGVVAQTGELAGAAGENHMLPRHVAKSGTLKPLSHQFKYFLDSRLHQLGNLRLGRLIELRRFMFAHYREGNDFTFIGRCREGEIIG